VRPKRRRQDTPAALQGLRRLHRRTPQPKIHLFGHDTRTICFALEVIPVLKDEQGQVEYISKVRLSVRITLFLIKYLFLE